MRAVDTNIVVQYLTRDDPAQASKARTCIEEQSVFIPRTVMLEVEWVLRSVYGLPSSRVVRSLRDLAGLPSVSVEDASVVGRALDWAAEGMDLADALHVSAAAKCTDFLTFDRRLARSAANVADVPVTLA